MSWSLAAILLLTVSASAQYSSSTSNPLPGVSADAVKPSCASGNLASERSPVKSTLERCSLMFEEIELQSTWHAHHTVFILLWLLASHHHDSVSLVQACLSIWKSFRMGVSPMAELSLSTKGLSRNLSCRSAWSHLGYWKWPGISHSRRCYSKTKPGPIVLCQNHLFWNLKDAQDPVLAQKSVWACPCIQADSYSIPYKIPERIIKLPWADSGQGPQKTYFIPSD